LPGTKSQGAGNATGSKGSLGSLPSPGTRSSSSPESVCSPGTPFIRSITHWISFRCALSAQSPVINILDTISNPLSWQGRAYATYRHDSGFGGTLYANYWGDYLNDTVNPVVKVDAWYTFDLALRYDLPQNEGFMSGMGVTLDVKNVFDRSPHYVQNGTLAFDPQVSDIVGRFFLFGVTKRF